MRFLGINFLTDKQLDKINYNHTKVAVKITYNDLNSILIPELERLKQDHWDKNAFDRIINFLKNRNC